MFPSLKLNTKMNLSPQMVVASKLLRASESELDGLLACEMAANPLLEQVTSPLVSVMENRGERFESLRQRDRVPGGTEPWFDSDDELLARCASTDSPLERLACQIRQNSAYPQRDLALALLAYLDEYGHLSATIECLAEELGADPDDLQAALRILYELEPPGIGARDARQCLLIQCQASENQCEKNEHAQRILKTAWDDFLHMRWERVARKVKCSIEQVDQAAMFLRRNCYPYPLALLDQITDRLIPLCEPDLIIQRLEKGEYRLEIPGESRFELRIRQAYIDDLDDSTPGAPVLSVGERAWVRTYVDRAHLVIRALQQRWETLRRVGEYLIEQQRKFLDSGPQHLVSMTRSEVARRLELSDSTISRAVQAKVLQLPDGRLLPLSDLFDHSLPIKAHIQRILAQSGHAINDREIAAQLRAQGITVARRTVAKYRAQLGVADSRRRWTTTEKDRRSSSKYRRNSGGYIQ